MPTACDACRTRKLKCSNRELTSPLLLPICENCVRAGIACISSERARRRRPRSGKIVDALRSDSGNGNVGASAHIPLPGLTHAPTPGQTQTATPLSWDNDHAWPGIDVAATPEIVSHTVLGQQPPTQQQLIHPSQLAVDNTAQGFAFYMHTIYATWPVINFDDFTRRLEAGHDTWDLDFQILGQALNLLQETYVYVFSPTDEASAGLLARVNVVDQLRCTYDYAEEARADTVVASFALFVSCIVIGKDKRALLYLAEASRLADFAYSNNRKRSRSGTHNKKDVRIEGMRIQRLKALVFITAMATALLSGDSAWRMERPSASLRLEDLTSWYGTTDEEMGEDGDESNPVLATKEVRDLDRFAVRQLLLMTRMYLSAGEGSLPSLSSSSSSSSPPSSLSPSSSPEEIPRRPENDDNTNPFQHSITLPGTTTVRIMTADLSITELWFSCDRRKRLSKRPADKDDDLSLSQLAASVELPEHIGRKALAWARSLTQSELRIVGLGKMVDIVENMVHLCRLCPDSTAEVEILAADLMAAIGTADYELRYAEAMAQCASILRQTADNMCLYVEETLGYPAGAKQ